MLEILSFYKNISKKKIIIRASELLILSKKKSIKFQKYVVRKVSCMHFREAPLGFPKKSLIGLLPGFLLKFLLEILQGFLHGCSQGFFFQGFTRIFFFGDPSRNDTRDYFKNISKVLPGTFLEIPTGIPPGIRSGISSGVHPGIPT